ncbi:hypothetical protein FIBSPDRAFT_896022 [Athelia psychrophila]|uniref:MARVEL domain-containing protein n=1 Tax=Athelia psychrophila TaxID=1759441 RepID=A0A166DVN0_9AGAM|nr:hypothetical protein FIBSPDRAFT_896022 [Fibularhizoctonia sp. CBS 109695]
MLHIARTVVFSLSSLFALIVLVLAANYARWADESIYDYTALAITTAMLTIITLPVIPAATRELITQGTRLIIDAMRSGVFTSMIFTELVTLFVLWVLWLATAAYITSIFYLFFDAKCNGVSDDYSFSVSAAACHQMQAIIAFSYLTWILLMVYYGVILVMGFIGANRGQRTWTTSVKEAGFFSPGPRYALAPSSNSASMQQQQYPPTNATTPSTANRAVV